MDDSGSQFWTGDEREEARLRDELAIAMVELEHAIEHGEIELAGMAARRAARVRKRLEAL